MRSCRKQKEIRTSLMLRMSCCTVYLILLLGLGIRNAPGQSTTQDRTDIMSMLATLSEARTHATCGPNDSTLSAVHFSLERETASTTRFAFPLSLIPRGAVYPIGSATDYRSGGYEITQGYRNADGHTGVDLANGSAGGDIRAAADGVVAAITTACCERMTDASCSGWGTMVRIAHTLQDGSTVYSQYGHMQCRSVPANITIGARVCKDQLIGKVGRTGYAIGRTGYHLHFELKTVNRNGCGYLPHSNCPNDSFNDFTEPFAFVAANVNAEGGSSEAFRPNGKPPSHPAGTLVKERFSPAVYLLQAADSHRTDLHRDLIASPAVLYSLYNQPYNSRQFDFRHVVTISTAELALYPSGGEISSPSSLAGSGRSQPPGALIRSGSTGEIAMVTNDGNRRAFPTLELFQSLGYLLCNVIDVADFGTYPLLNAPITGSELDAEVISTPSAPSGPSNGTAASTYSYSTGGASSSLSHSVQYRFDWGDGTTSGWLPAGTTSASHSWTAGTYTVHSEARCTTHNSAVSTPSSGLSVKIIPLPGPPANPSPADGATGVVSSPSLNWTSGSGSASHDVYFGTSSSPPFVQNTTGTSYSPAALIAGKTYYWRVEAKNSVGTAASPTWSFTTHSGVSPPGTPSNPLPANGAIGVLSSPLLSWTGGSGAISHDVYFGASSSPPFVQNTAGTSYSPGALIVGNTYYWRVEAKNGGGTTSSMTWSFSVASTGSAAIGIIKVNPTLVGLVRGRSRDVSVAISRTHYTGAVSLGTGVLPNGVSTSPVNPFTGTAGTITFNAAANATPVTAEQIAITASGTGVNASSPIRLTVGPMPGVPVFGSLVPVSGAVAQVHSLGIGPTGAIYVLSPSGNGLAVWKSVNGGVSFSSAVPVPNSSFDNLDYSLCVDPSGGIHVVWWRSSTSGTETFYSRSTDEGSSFTPPITVRTGTVMNGYRTENATAPVVSADGNGRVYVAYAAFTRDSNSSFVGYNIWVSKSVDNGTTFEPEFYVVTPSSTQKRPIRIYSSPTNVFILFADETNRDLYFYRGGTTGIGTGATRINTMPGALLYLGADLTVDPGGSKVYVVFADATGDAEGNVRLCRSLDGGSTWGSCVAVNDDPYRWQVGPAITLDHFGILHVVWADFRSESKYQLFYARSIDEGLTFSSPNINLTVDQPGSNFTQARIAFDPEKVVLYTSASRNYNQVVVGKASVNAAPLEIIGPANLPAGTVGSSYSSITIAASGGTPPFTWSATGLPAGLGISPSTGLISGTPTTSTGTPFGVVISVTDSASAVTSRNYALTVNAPSAAMYSISGQVTKTGSGLSGVSVTLTGGPGGTQTTNASGNYAFTNLPAGGNYTVTPSLANHTFTPASAPFSNLQANMTASFVAAARSVTTPTESDFNGDGKPDILWQNPDTGELWVWFLNGTVWTGNAPISGPTTWRVPAVGDFNGDGKTDLLWQNPATGELWVWYMNGTTRTSDAPISGPTEWRVPAVADMNGDGKPDILWQHPGTGELWVWYMNGVTRTGNAPISGPTAWRVPAVGDLNGDNKPDILWQHPTTGELWVWLMNGTTRSSDAPVSGPTVWRVPAARDMNGDGKPDILWQHPDTGELWTWFMNGTAWAGNAPVSGPTTWRVPPLR
jgi:hypothetical protein